MSAEKIGKREKKKKQRRKKTNGKADHIHKITRFTRRSVFRLIRNQTVVVGIVATGCAEFAARSRREMVFGVSLSFARGAP